LLSFAKGSLRSSGGENFLKREMSSFSFSLLKYFSPEGVDSQKSLKSKYTASISASVSSRNFLTISL